MKKYITPYTESQELLYGGILCHSQDGKGMMVSPKPESGDKKVF